MNHLAQESAQVAQHRQETLLDGWIFDQPNPLDPTLLYDLVENLNQVMDCAPEHQARITVLSVDDFQSAVKRVLPPRLIAAGLASHFRVLVDPRDPHHIMIGPSALAGLNEGHANVVADLVYHLIDAYGIPTNLAFERGAADLIAAAVSKRMGLVIFTQQYPADAAFLSDVIEAIRRKGQSPLQLIGMLKRDPNAFFGQMSKSPFLKWWVASCRQDPRLAHFVDTIRNLPLPSTQPDELFMQWAAQCASVFAEYRVQAREVRKRKRLATAMKVSHS